MKRLLVVMAFLSASLLHAVDSSGSAWRYADWAAYYLGEAVEEECAPSWTDETGVANLLRFALGVGPHPAAVPGLGHEVIPSEHGDAEITLRFPQRRDAPDLAYEIITSTNMIDWEPVPGPWDITDVTPGEPGIDWITVRLPCSPSTSCAFYKLRIRLISTATELPADPVEVAQPFETGVVSLISDGTSFLYRGDNPIQREVDTTKMDEVRAAVIRGRLLDIHGAPLPGVRVSINNRPEFGYTLSRADGMYDMAVNGGGQLSVNFNKEGYLRSQRKANVPWQNFLTMQDVTLIAPDAKATLVQFGADTPIQVAAGSPVSDSDGVRRPTLIFPAGTVASIVTESGVTQPVDSLTVRLTEYTTGPNGPSAMPAELPPTSYYTHCVELSADEAEHVVFDSPVFYYLDNFLGFPVGGTVPLAYYDFSGAGAWVPTPDGRVIALTGVNAAGLAEIDLDGDGSPEADGELETFGFTADERATLALNYAAPCSLWRVPIPHFTPWDPNWPIVYPEGAVPPRVADPITTQTQKLNRPSEAPHGGTIDIEGRVFREEIAASGTPYTLNYSSDRSHGLVEEIHIAVSGDAIPASLVEILLEVQVAGQSFKTSFQPSPNLSYTYIWDRRDAYGRFVNGSAVADVRIGYVYDGVFGETDTRLESSFGSVGGRPLSPSVPSRVSLSPLWQKFSVPLGGINSNPFGMGGWSLSAHHVYDPVGQVLYYGDGTERRQGMENLNRSVHCVAGQIGRPPSWPALGDGGPATEATLDDPAQMDFRPDGSFYISENDRIRYVNSDGIIDTVLECEWWYGANGSGRPVACGPDERLFTVITDENWVKRVVEVNDDGTTTVIAGSGEYGYSGDNGPATQAALSLPYGLAVAADGTLYIADTENSVVRSVAPNGIISTVAGTGVAGFSGDGGPAINAELNNPWDIAVDSNGNLYIADTKNLRVRIVRPDGIIETFWNYGEWSGEDWYLDRGWDPEIGPVSLALNSADDLYVSIGLIHFFTEPHENRGSVFHVDVNRNVSWVLGYSYEWWHWPSWDARSQSVPGLPAADFSLAFAGGIAFSPDDRLHVVDRGWYGTEAVVSVSKAFPGFNASEILIPSECGSLLYHFDKNGRHFRTLDSLTQTPLLTFGYDDGGLLVTLTDNDGLVTTIHRDANGVAQRITGPYGQQTALEYDAEGWLSAVVNPEAEVNTMRYAPGGLLTQVTNRRGHDFVMAYDESGNLLRAEDPSGGKQSLEYAELDNGYQVTKTTAMGRTQTYAIEKPSDEVSVRTFTDSAGLTSIVYESSSAWVQTVTPDGTEMEVKQGPDPRFGMQAPFPEVTRVKTPSGLISETRALQEVVLADPDNPLNVVAVTSSVTVDAHTRNPKTATSEYIAADRTTTVRSPMGREALVRTDIDGRPVSISSPGLYPVENTYDDTGRLIAVTQGLDAEARTTRFTYNENGYLSAIRNALDEVVHLESDLIGRTTKSIRADGTTVQMAYDRSESPVLMTLPHDQPHAFTYTPIGLGESYIPPDLLPGDDRTRYTWNADRQLVSTIRPGGQVISNAYDFAGRLIGVSWPGGGLSNDYDNESGHLAAVTSQDDEGLAFTYDGPLLTGVAFSGTVTGSISYAYDTQFRVKKMTYPNNSAVDILYDDDGMLTGSGSFLLHRNPVTGFLTHTEIGQISDARSFNGFGELTDYSATFGTDELYASTIERDKLGRISTLHETVLGEVREHTYTYDALGQLITAVTSDSGESTTHHYFFDANGNRTSFVSSDSDPIEGVHDAQDRLLTYGTATYAYADNGEITRMTVNGQTTGYTYDAPGRLMGVTLPSGDQIDYIRDPLARLIGRKVNGSIEKRFIYKDSLCPIMQLDASGAVVATFIYGTRLNVPEYMEKNGNRYRLITDHIGSVRLVVDVQTGVIAQRLDFDEYGNVLLDTNPGFQPFGFQGGLYDHDTGLTQFGARWYDPHTGRWLSKDPIGLNGGLNLYVFCGNNPVNFMDPVGLSKVKVVESGPYLFKQIPGDMCHGGPHWHVHSRRGGRLLGRVSPSGKVLTGQVPKSAIRRLLSGAAFSTIMFVMQPSALGDSTITAPEFMTPEQLWLEHAYQVFDHIHPDFALNEQGGRSWTSDLIKAQSSWIRDWLANNPVPENVEIGYDIDKTYGIQPITNK